MDKIFSNPSDKLSLVAKIFFYVLSCISILIGLGVVVLGAVAQEGFACFVGFLIMIFGPAIVYFFTLAYLLMIGGFRNLSRIADAQEFMASAYQEECDCDCGCKDEDGSNCGCEHERNNTCECAEKHEDN